MTDEQRLIERLRSVERLFAGAATPGERQAAANALERIQARLEQMREVDPPVEYRFTLPDMWSRRLFVALLRRYGIRPYRYRRQRYTTVMAKVPQLFVDETLWPEFEKLTEMLRSFLDDVTNRVISQAVCSDSSEAEVVEGSPKQLAGGDGE